MKKVIKLKHCLILVCPTATYSNYQMLSFGVAPLTVAVLLHFLLPMRLKLQGQVTDNMFSNSEF